MSKYIFTPVVYASLKPIEFEANSDEEAMEKAQELFEPATLCWSCADGVELGDEPIWDKQYLELVE